jgi:hypothetical protein
MIKKIKQVHIKRFDAAIELMEWVDKNKKKQFNMKDWQADEDNIVSTIKQASECGTVCCFAGWLALSDEFKKAKGKVSNDGGYPILDGFSGSQAISKYFGISPTDASLLVCVGVGYERVDDTYGCKINEVKPADVVKQLKILKYKYTL